MLPAVKWETAAQYQIGPSWHFNDISGNRMRKECQDETQFLDFMEEDCDWKNVLVGHYFSAS